MSLPLNLRGQGDRLAPGLFKVLGLCEALEQRFDLGRVLVDLREGIEADLGSLASLGFAGAITAAIVADSPLPLLHSLSIDEAVAAGDAIRFAGQGKINVLYRRQANANTLFVTERCNSLCLMCSQPPRDDDDDWRIRELHELLPLIDPELAVLGVTGGEPTLLGQDLVDLLTEARKLLPQTHLHVLSNGRTFADPAFADRFHGLRQHVTWAVPLYADVADTHDFIVQASGAFTETVHGLHNLAERGHRIEIRTVLHALSLPRLEALAWFIYRNLPFVDHVALMGLEPMGLARGNHALLDAHPLAIAGAIAPAVSLLHQAGLNVSIYNLPLCVLTPALWPFARRSISDWKNEYAAACEACLVKTSCCGFFRSAPLAWRNAVARPPEEAAA